MISKNQINTCKTCVHWTDIAPYDQPERFMVRMCECPKFQEDFYSHEEDSLCYSYLEGGKFYTGPKFGCIHHSEGSK